MAIFGGRNIVAATFVAKDEASKSVNQMRKNIASLGGPRFGVLGQATAGLATMQTGAFLAAGAFTATIGAALELGDAIGGMTSMAMKEQEGIARLGASLKANIAGFDGNTDSIEATIAANERLGVSDSEQRDALAILVTRTHSVTVAQSLLREGMDLARLKSISLADSVNILSKVYGGQMTAARRAGIAISENATAAEALAQISAATAGQQEAFAKSAVGKATTLGIRIQDLQEEIGTQFIPIVSDAFDAVNNFLNPPPPPKSIGDILKEGMGQAVEIVQQDIGTLTHRLDFLTPSMFAAAEQVFGTIPKAAKVAGAEVPTSIADGIKSNESAVKDAMFKLKYDIEHPQQLAKEKSFLLAQLASRNIKRGLASNEPAIRKETQDFVNYIKGLLGQLDDVNVAIDYSIPRPSKHDRLTQHGHGGSSHHSGGGGGGHGGGRGRGGGGGHGHDILIDGHKVGRAVDQANGRDPGYLA